MFRKAVVLFVVFLALTANHTVFSQAVAIDAALSNAVKEIAESVPKGTKIAVLNMSSDYGSLSDYIIDELIVNLVNTRSFQVVPRSTVDLAAARREFAFQMSGDVSDDSQKRLGQFLGAGTIVSGSITRDSANSYRLVVNAIDLESFTYQTAYRTSIQNNNKMKELVTAFIGAGVVFGLIVPFFHHKPDNTRVSQSDFPFNLELVSSNNQGGNGLRVSYRVRF